MKLIRWLTFPSRYLRLRKHYPRDVARRKAKAGRKPPRRSR